MGHEDAENTPAKRKNPRDAARGGTAFTLIRARGVAEKPNAGA